MKVYGHRGYNGKRPKNTVLVFRKAAEAERDGIGLGVQLTKDGKLVVIHDEAVGRTTDGARLVRNYTYEEPTRFDVGVIKDGVFGFQRTPLFEKYCAWATGEVLVINVEIKSSAFYCKEAEEKTVDTVRGSGLTKQVMISSLNYMSLIHMKQLGAEIKTGALVSQTVTGNIGYYCQQFGIPYYHLNVKTLAKEMAEECRMKGVRISARTVDDMGALERMRGWDCDGMITNEMKMRRGEIEGQMGTKEEDPLNHLRLWGDLAGFLGSASRGWR